MMPVPLDEEWPVSYRESPTPGNIHAPPCFRSRCHAAPRRSCCAGEAAVTARRAAEPLQHVDSEGHCARRSDARGALQLDSRQGCDAGRTGVRPHRPIQYLLSINGARREAARWRRTRHARGAARQGGHRSPAAPIRGVCAEYDEGSAGDAGRRRHATVRSHDSRMGRDASAGCTHERASRPVHCVRAIEWSRATVVAVRGHEHAMTTSAALFSLTLADFQQVRARIAPHIKHTPLLTSRQLSEATGYEVRLKAEMFQRVGSYKIRGPLNKFALMPEEQKRRGVVCSSAGNHAQDRKSVV